jgi:hypothetical protein
VALSAQPINSSDVNSPLAILRHSIGPQWNPTGGVPAEIVTDRSGRTCTLAIIWRDQMSIDNGLIDNAHKCLINIVNDLDVIHADAGMPRQVTTILDPVEPICAEPFPARGAVTAGGGL